MKPVFSLLSAIFLTVAGYSQCVNGFSKLLPELTTDYGLNFGKSVSMYDNYLAVGVPDSDTVGRQSGIVYIYEKVNAQWIKRASMVASMPVRDLRLGVNVKLSKNYLLVSAEAEGGKVLIYKKSSTGWVSSTELATVSLPNTEAFGVAYHHPVDISPDENTIVVADALKRHNVNPTTIAGSLFVYHKVTNVEWSNSITPVEIKATTDVIDLGRAGVYISGTKIITGTPFTPTGFGNAFIYNDPSGNFSAPVLEALLSPPPSMSAWMNNLVATEDGIMWSVAGSTQQQLMFFEKPASGNWINATPTYMIDPDNQPTPPGSSTVLLATNGQDIYATTRSGFYTYVTLIKKGTSGWADPDRETIDARFFTENRYGQAIACNQNTNVVVGYGAHPNNSLAHNALRVYSKNATNLWISSPIYSIAKSTREHYYGQRMEIHGEYLFVSAIRDNTIKEQGGKVYIYKNDGTAWNQITTITTPLNLTSQPRLGSALAANDNFLAVGATGVPPVGRFYIYKNFSDWTDVQPFQEIIIPDDDATIISYGDHAAMNDRWLVIPYGDYPTSGLDTKIAIFEFDGASWVYRESVSTGLFNFFSRYSTLDIDINGNMFVFGGKIFELDADNHWQKIAELSPTDPEGIRFNSSFQMIQNGGYFGQAVFIDGDNIFIGAPRRDHESTWDVGAVYVYNKPAGQPWTNRTETLKITPTVKQGSGLFGFSLFARDGLLMVGAPMDDNIPTVDLFGYVPHNIPGKAFLFRALNNSWTTAAVASVFEGETHVLDKFGYQVALNEKKVIISSGMEDIQTGRISGAVYITDKPPIITPVNPLCAQTAGSITLIASPSGGIWAGPGIRNAATGLFDPILAGAGTHQITYSLPGSSCPDAKIFITVYRKPDASLITSKTFIVCEEASISIPLSVRPVGGASYQWYYRENSSGQFNPIAISSTITAYNRGEYQVKVYNATCETFSDIITISNESVDVLVDAVVETCESPVTGLMLNASPTGGIWSGPGITNNKFFSNALADGSYPVTYRYTSARGCIYQEQTVIKLERLKPPSISRTGNLCLNGDVILSSNTVPINGATYTWEWRENNNENFAEHSSGITTHINTWGEYRLAVNKEHCSAISQPITISDKFSMDLSPMQPSSEVCHDNEFQFMLPSDMDASYQWSFSADGSQYEIIPGSNNVFHPTKTGHYFATITRGVCSFNTPSRYIYIHSRDSVFVPNVFTPNGDGRNDGFKITVLNQDDDLNDGDIQDVTSYAMFNRYGKLIFSAPHNEEWTASEISAGIYFWTGTYHTCNGTPQVIKGWVQLIK